MEGAEGGPVLVEVRSRDRRPRVGEDGLGSNSERTIALKEALACSGDDEHLEMNYVKELP